MASDQNLRDMLDRVTRLMSADLRDGPLNPVQREAVLYLARANRFSRQPSHLADYLAATRGTVSQTLKSLVKKGLVAEERASEDRRVIRMALTAEGQALAGAERGLDQILQALPDADKQALSEGLGKIVAALIAARGGRSFGLCVSCRHHQPGEGQPRCALLDLPLLPQEALQICHEHSAK